MTIKDSSNCDHDGTQTEGSCKSVFLGCAHSPSLRPESQFCLEDPICPVCRKGLDMVPYPGCCKYCLCCREHCMSSRAGPLHSLQPPALRLCYLPASRVYSSFIMLHIYFSLEKNKHDILKLKA